MGEEKNRIPCLSPGEKGCSRTHRWYCNSHITLTQMAMHIKTQNLQYLLLNICVKHSCRKWYAREMKRKSKKFISTQILILELPSSFEIIKKNCQIFTHLSTTNYISTGMVHLLMLLYFMFPSMQFVILLPFPLFLPLQPSSHISVMFMCTSVQDFFNHANPDNLISKRRQCKQSEKVFGIVEERAYPF